MRRLLVTVGVLVAFLLLYLVLDVVAKGFVEGRVEEEFVNGDRVDVEDASFVIDSFPFLGRLGAYGEVSATLELQGVARAGRDRRPASGSRWTVWSSTGCRPSTARSR